MRIGRLPDRRRAELARLEEVDTAVGRLVEQWRGHARADSEVEIVVAAARALLGVVRRFEGAELRILVGPEQAVTVRVAEEGGRAVAELDVPGPSAAGHTDRTSDRLPLPGPRGPGSSQPSVTPPRGNVPGRFLRADVAREIAARRAARGPDEPRDGA